ncbi:hypothetical protein LJR267_010489 [Paraburkholderia hospita]|jgi:hypothetical protein|uniref:hypothetical protein n=1 Tax=Paraburkholderia hospita TaxID=169430 RepID=UPI003ED08D43
MAHQHRAVDEAVNNALMQQMVRQVSKYVDACWDALSIDIVKPAPEQQAEELQQ